jgi:5-methylcytosine-specific restriction protein A
MPYAAKRPCSYPGCPALVDSGRCTAHTKQQWRQQDARRGNRIQRGYDATWYRLRAMVLAEEPLCQDCTEQGRTTPANEVHHMVTIRQRPDLRLERSNLRSLCKPCHSKRTLVESVTHSA